MDRPVMIAFLLAAIISLGISDYFVKKPFVDSGNARALVFPAAQSSGELATSIVSGNSFSSSPNGLQIIDFQTNRTTFGFSNSSYTQPFNPSLANKKVALGCDSVQIDMTAVVAGTSANDSLGFKISYGNPDNSPSATQIFLFDNGQVNFKVGNNNFNCNLPQAAVTVNAVAGVKTVNFNLHACLIGLGLNLQPGDTVRFSGKFVVNANGPITPMFKPVPNLKAFAYATQNGLALSCDTLLDTFNLAKSQVIFDFPNTLNGLPVGCNQGKLTWRLFVPNNDFSTYFGNELRPATKVDSLVFDFDPGFLTAFTGGAMEVSIPGHPVFGNSYFPIRPLSDFPDGHYVAKFDTLAFVPSLNLVQTYTFDLRLNLKATCESPVGSIFNSNVYGIQSKVAYTDRFYANFIGNGSCVNKQTDQATSTVAYTQPPSFNLSPATSSTAILTGGTATWDLKLCNTSSQSNSGINWFSVNDPSGLLTVNSITNITNPGNPVALTLMPFGQNVFVFTPGINAGQCLTLRIVSTTSSCDDLTLDAAAGWNCGSYPTGWKPFDNAPCSSVSLPLTLQNNGVAPVQINFTNVEASCTANGETVALSGNLGSGTTLANDTYQLSFVWDENGDGNAGTNESVLASQTLFGVISPANSLIFNQILSLQSAQACQILLQVEMSGPGLCNSITAQMPTPQYQLAGNDRSFCDVGNTYTTTLGVGQICDTANYKISWTAIAPASISDLNDPNIADPILSFDPMNYLGQTLGYVAAIQNLACGTTSFDTVQIIVPSSANGVFAQQQLDLQVADCQSLALVCTGISPLLFPNFVVLDNGQLYTGNVSPCAGGSNLQIAPGFHLLIATDTTLGCADTINVTVNCTSIDTIQVALLLGEMDTICLGSAELTGPVFSLNNICQDGQYVGYQVLNDSCLVFSGNLVGQETACLVVCDINGFCDTTVVLTTVSHPFPNGIFDTLTLTQTGQFCFDENDLNLTGTLSSIQNICSGASGNAVQFSVDDVGFCVDYTAVGIGIETACIQLCDDLGNCDTVNLTVTVIPGSLIQDTIFLLLETGSYCLPVGWLSGPAFSVQDICPQNHGDNVNFTVQGDCILYNGFAVGVDTACFRFEDAFGNVALVELQVHVRKTNPDSFCDTIFVGQTKLHCLDLSELPSDFENGSLKEICPGEGTGNVELTINQTGSCVYYEGISEGRDSACIVYCDELGFCDTSYFCFFVKTYFDPPILLPDSVSTLKGTPVVIDFLANDTIYGGIDDIYVLKPPVGSVTLNLDNSFTYIPKEPNCDFYDNFTYVACNPNGCDTTQVTIFVNCIELTVFTAVSPNNDGVNDFFYIAKIEEFPDNHLWVYNIWGSLVYESLAYRNNWPGTWGADTDLPDGTYYYILDWKDNDVKITQKGFIELFR